MKEYRITTGDLAFSGRVPLSGRMLMRDPVDGDHLRQAVELTAQRLPFIRSELVGHDGRLWLRENDRPFTVAEGEAALSAEDPRGNGHVFGFAFQENQILFRYEHTVCDGHGFAGIFRTLRSYYCLLHYGVPVREPTVDYSDPYEYARMPEKPIPPFRMTEAFAPAPEELLPDGGHFEYSLTLPGDGLLGAIKRLSGSPTTLMALLLSRAIAAVYPDRDAPVVTRIAADVRRILGCPATAQNCLIHFYLPYSDTVARMSPDRQMTCFRGMLFRQTDPDYVHQTMALQRQRYEHLVETRRGGREERDPAAGMTVLLSSVGKIGQGPLDPYCGPLVMDSGRSFAPFNLAVMEKDGMFSVSLASRTKSRDVYEALLRQLDRLGVPYTAGPVKRI